jgi:hypothetical protein
MATVLIVAMAKNVVWQKMITNASNRFLPVKKIAEACSKASAIA